MNLFRIPLNILVVVALRNADSIPLKYSFYMSGASIAIAYLLSMSLEGARAEVTEKQMEMEKTQA